MNQSEIKDQIAGYLKAHPFMTLATVTPQGEPLAHTVAYASQGCTVYFTTRRDTRKALNLGHDARVAYCVDEAYQDFMEIKGVQMEGRAWLMNDPAELVQAAALYAQKFGPGINFPPSPEHVCFKVTPAAAYFLDYAQGFGHRDLIHF